MKFLTMKNPKLHYHVSEMGCYLVSYLQIFFFNILVEFLLQRGYMISCRLQKLLN